MAATLCNLQVLLDHVAKLGVHLLADVDGERAARIEAAAAQWVDRAGHIADQYDPLVFLLHHRIGKGDGGEARFGAGVQRIAIRAIPIGQFDDLAELHHRDGVGNVSHY